MNDEDDLLFDVKPSPPPSPKQKDYIQSSSQQVLLMQIHTHEGEQVNYGIKYDSDQDETIKELRTRIAREWNTSDVLLVFEGKIIQDDKLVKEVDMLTYGKQAKIHVVLNNDKKNQET